MAARRPKNENPVRPKIATKANGQPSCASADHANRWALCGEPSTANRGTRMFARFALFVLICALVVPSAAWDAHVSGHDELSSQASLHTHHADHAHEQSGDTALEDQQERSQGAPGKALTHDHGPSQSLSAGLLASVGPTPLSWPASDIMHFVRNSTDDAQSRQQSLLRPPRHA